MRKKDELAIDLGQSLFQPAHFGARMQPGIDAEPEALFRMARQPDMRRLVHKVTAGEDATIHLLGKLRHITAIDEHHGLGVCHKRNTR